MTEFEDRHRTPARVGLVPATRNRTVLMSTLVAVGVATMMTFWWWRQDHRGVPQLDVMYAPARPAASPQHLALPSASASVLR